MNMELRRQLKLIDNKLNKIGYKLAIDCNYADIRPIIPFYNLPDDVPESYLKFVLIKKPVNGELFRIECTAEICKMTVGGTHLHVTQAISIARYWTEYLKIALEITKMGIVCSNKDFQECVLDINNKRRK